MSEVRKAKHGGLLTALFSIISAIYVMPIIIVLYNSFKKKIFISKRPFALPDGKSFVGMENYISGIEKIELPKAFGYSLFITVASVRDVYAVCVLNDYTFSNGNVYIIQNS